MGMALLRATILASVVPASMLPTVPNREPDWSLTDLAGRLVELSASTGAAHLTAAFGLVLDAQMGGESTAWITLEHSSFFPPDVADGGIDLHALPVVCVPDALMAGRAASHLVRSGGFGLVVIDLSSEDGNMTGKTKLPVPLLTRLLGLARQQNVTVLFLTRKSQEYPSLHSLISLRAEARWHRQEGRYELSICALKDKREGRRWTHVEMCRGPAGLC
jgi:recombination protein RecA